MVTMNSTPTILENIEMSVCRIRQHSLYWHCGVAGCAAVHCPECDLIFYAMDILRHTHDETQLRYQTEGCIRWEEGMSYDIFCALQDEDYGGYSQYYEETRTA